MWTPERHAALVAVRQRHPRQTDVETAAELARRRDMRGVTPKMVRDRWLNHVVFSYRPSLSEMDAWAPMVTELVAEHGKSWAKVGSIVRSRVRKSVSNEAIKRIWLRHQKRQAKKATRMQHDEKDLAELPYALRSIFEQIEPFDDADVSLVYLPLPDTPAEARLI